MWFFDKKDPAKEYEQHKQAYLDKTAVARNKTQDVRLRMFKADQEGQLAKLNVEVKEGCLKLGDLLEIEYSINNKLGISDAIAEVKEIYQIHNDGGLFSKDELVPVKEAYEQDLVWIMVSGVDVKLIMNNGMIRKTKSKSNLAQGAHGSAMSVSSDAEVSTMVNYFKNELNGYFVNNKPISHITQDLSYGLKAQKKRLDSFSITMTTEVSSDITAATTKMEVNRYSSSQYDVAEANEGVKLKRTYASAGHTVYEDDDWRICHYLLAGSKYNSDGLVMCPNCGNYAEREEILNGCPYCNTQFKIQDLSLRVAGYAQKQIEQSKWDKLQGKFDVGAALSYESKQKEYDQVLKLRMSKVDPLFSPTAFYNSMRNKLYSIVFAENVVALRSFADEDFDVAPFYEKFKNVIDLDIQEIKTKNFEKSDSYIITDVIMSVMVLRYDNSGDTAEWSKEKVTMSFVKHIDNKTRNIFEPSIIQCKCCGGSYNLYEGKACSYCGNEIDYPMYDWLLIDLKLEVEPNK